MYLLQRNARGFTLIETIVATGILAVAAVAIASLFVSSLRTFVSNRERSTAAILLSDKIEQLKVSATPGEGSDNASGFKRSWRVDAGQSKTITVIVYDSTNRELIRSSTTVSAAW